MNIYISQFKDAVKNYLADAQKIQSKINSNNEKLSAEYASSENKPLEANYEKRYQRAKQTINELFENAREMLSIASLANPESLTVDRLLFDKTSSINLSAEETACFVDRYADNPTMLRLILSWIDREHNGLSEFTNIRKNIHLPEEQVQVYQKFANSALQLIESIHKDALNFSELTLKSYADEQFGAELFSVIGDGMNLSEFRNRRVSEKAKHLFDDVTLNQESNNNFQFNYKPVQN